MSNVATLLAPPFTVTLRTSPNFSAVVASCHAVSILGKSPRIVTGVSAVIRVSFPASSTKLAVRDSSERLSSLLTLYTPTYTPSFASPSECCPSSNKGRPRISDFGFRISELKRMSNVATQKGSPTNVTVKVSPADSTPAPSCVREIISGGSVSIVMVGSKVTSAVMPYRDSLICTTMRASDTSSSSNTVYEPTYRPSSASPSLC